MENQKIAELCEPCNCGDHLRHNDGGNYHGKILVWQVAEQEMLVVKTTSTCKLHPNVGFVGWSATKGFKIWSPGFEPEDSGKEPFVMFYLDEYDGAHLATKEEVARMVSLADTSFDEAWNFAKVLPNVPKWNAW